MADAPKAYWINVFTSIRDADKLAEYARLATPAIAEAGGRFLARGPAAAVLEGAGDADRTTLIEFDTVDAAVACYHSEGYQRALKVLGDTATRELRIAQGT
ncbi:MAG: DUF1330 domain-containing protein [Pseudonocardia sp.]